MKKRDSTFLMVVSGLLILYFYNCFNLGGFGESTVVATVNETSITMKQLRQFSINTYGGFDPANSREILDMMINQEILLIHAEKSGIIQNVLNPQFEKQERYAKDRLMLEMFFDLEAEKNVHVTRREIDNYFNTQPIFEVRGLSFYYSDDEAEEKARLATRELNRLGDFNTVYRMFFPDHRISRPGFIGLANYFHPPDFLQEHIEQLSRTGEATNPIETLFGYIVYFRGVQPSLKDSREFIANELLNIKKEDFKQERYEEIIRNNRPNLFIIDQIYNQGHVLYTQETIVTNRLTNDFMTIIEFLDRLGDLYNIYTINNLSYQEFLDYINLFISQKTILSLASENGFFTNRQFLINWSEEQMNLRENQKIETINYMLEYIYDSQSRNISDADLQRFYNRNRNLYRRSDFFKLQTIVLNDRATANRAFEEAQINPDFSSIVLTYSNDPFKNSTNGIGPFQERSELENSYDILFERNVGEIIAPIEVEPNVFHVYKILERVQGAVRPIDEVVTQMIPSLMFERMQDYINELVHNYGIQIMIYEDRLEGN
ncbi:MAG: peptidyl-prolyl cis-trans isomerase [Candidatus Cloacimonetes bacterium]|nr:peptidyl-prolyl cis-trans isomerase [Candidatus Cloacimonadota bacterium]